ncbi:hypothetical protein V2A85_04920 [Yersinia sp. 1252 StPb PI]|uniref:hypothetical protein n=1 Tax=Yersinia sp. 1252 StPb PI TaxID=3117404 RepID=UPI003B2834D1
MNAFRQINLKLAKLNDLVFASLIILNLTDLCRPPSADNVETQLSVFKVKQDTLPFKKPPKAQLLTVQSIKISQMLKIKILSWLYYKQ